MNPNPDTDLIAGARRADIAIFASLLVLFLSVPAWADAGLVFLAGVVLVQIVFALSFNTIFGLAGMVSFGHAAYFAGGAYAAGLILKGEDPSIMAALAAGGLAGGAMAWLVGALALRRASGNYFAILTLALAELLHVVISKSTVLGREDGLTGIARPRMHLFGVATLDLAQGTTLFYFLLALAVLLGAGAWLLWHGPFGRVLAALRQEPERAAFLGIDVHRARLAAFVLSGAGAGLAGAMYAPLAQLLTPEVAHWSYSALPILFCLLGGSAFYWGPVAGVLVFLGLEHATRNIVGLSEIVIGATLLCVVLAFPGGMAGAVARLARRRGQGARAATAHARAAAVAGKEVDA
ncbi:branched-chain amino acid ABC transporter permease [Cupriavidus sp. 30B13]|uniref:branched-chain amino acid ABC transporter permease n=1 Tax=Cupriavidus sp. 30B13 TaxID=3384241 RepID=UPI003B91BE2B